MPLSDFAKKAATAKRYTKLVECYRQSLDESDISDLGFVVDATDEYLLLQLVDDRITLNGYSLIRLQDISELETEVEHTRFIEKALEIRKKKVKHPALVDLTDIGTILFSVDQNFPLMTIHREAHDSDTVYVGSVESICDKTVLLNEMNPDAKWEGTKRILLDEITRIDFGGGYETALALVAKLQ
jgi:hypothetical protein